ncbi:hypothetical protein HELRODRAFT_184384 [Helobdella robusta]|uniref:Uncharacterized protein n=1 Tax=Helobdella robusta TaxID=6412 RepID=T1FL36_HELRO|nr:hypothetical protein HELRODRAFT_184384 [Helobdella robusta]ESN99678.1 hypothetical protein HELRODRAFT_184384 [Helobdella robusta]
MEINPEEGTLCDTTNSGLGASIGIELGPISEKYYDEEYVESNDVRSVFLNLIAGLMVERPADYVTYIESKLKEIQHEKNLEKKRFVVPLVGNIDLGPIQCREKSKSEKNEKFAKVIKRANGFKFADAFHPSMSPIKRELYHYCPDDSQVSTPKNEKFKLDPKHPIDVYDLASRIEIPRGFGTFEEMVKTEKELFDITLINPSLPFNFELKK